MAETHEVAYGHWRDASEKFDYFVLGVTGALAAYIGQQLTPTRLGFTPETLEIVALLCFALAALLGFRRLEATLVVLNSQARRLERQAAGDHQTADALRSAADPQAKRAERFAHWRNRALFAGFALLVVSRVLPAYVAHDPVPRSPETPACARPHGGSR